MIITFPDGSNREYPDGISPLSIAESISPRLAKATVSCLIDGKNSDVFRPIHGDHLRQ